jgi:hypothetical protein
LHADGRRTRYLTIEPGHHNTAHERGWKGVHTRHTNIGKRHAWEDWFDCEGRRKLTIAWSQTAGRARDASRQRLTTDQDTQQLSTQRLRRSDHPPHSRPNTTIHTSHPPSATHIERTSATTAVDKMGKQTGAEHEIHRRRNMRETALRGYHKPCVLAVETAGCTKAQPGLSSFGENLFDGVSRRWGPTISGSEHSVMSSSCSTALFRYGLVLDR